ncbi:unnamed protein product [Rotaria socialis]
MILDYCSTLTFSSKFDYTFDGKASIELVYHFTAAVLIDTIYNGCNTTVFAYGQTGFGKTFTMGGGDLSLTKIDLSLTKIDLSLTKIDLSLTKIDLLHGIYA